MYDTVTTTQLALGMLPMRHAFLSRQGIQELSGSNDGTKVILIRLLRSCTAFLCTHAVGRAGEVLGRRGSPSSSAAPSRSCTWARRAPWV